MKKIIIIFIVMVVFGFGFVFYTVRSNDKYLNSVKEDIANNYDVVGKIEYLNIFDRYYILLDSDNLIVLDEEYSEIFKEKRSVIYNKDYDIVYRLNKVMYESKVVEKSKVSYSYYDIYTFDKIDEIVIGG